MTLKTYNPEVANISIAGTPCNDWEEISFSYEDERYEFTTATSGMVTRSKVLNRLGQVELIIPQGGDVSELLDNFIGMNDTFDIVLNETLAEGNVTTFMLSNGTIVDPGERKRGRTAEDKTIIIKGLITKFVELPYTD